MTCHFPAPGTVVCGCDEDAACSYHAKGLTMTCYCTNDTPCRPCLDTATCVPQMLSFPSVSTAFPGAYTFAQPSWVNFEKKIEIMDNFSKQVGNHSFKFGADYAKLPTFYASLMLNSPGNMAFFDDPSTILNNTNGRYPLGFRTPGIVRSITQTSLQQVDAWSHKAFYFAGYAQDDWKASPRLTLNLGLRYEMATMVDEVHNRIANLRRLADPSVTTGGPCRMPIIPAGSFPPALPGRCSPI